MSAQLDDLTFRQGSLLVAWVPYPERPDPATRLQTFALDGRALDRESSAFTTEPLLSPVRVLFAPSGQGQLLAGLTGTTTRAELLSADGAHSRTSVNDPGSLVGTARTADSMVHIATVTTGATQTFNVLSLAPDSLRVERENTIVYPNATGPSVAIAPAANNALLAVFAQAVVGPSSRIHAIALRGAVQEEDQVLDTVDSFLRPTVFAVGGTNGAWALWSSIEGDLWGARLRSSARSFAPKQRIAQNLAASEGTALLQLGTQVIIVANERAANRDAPIAIRLLIIDESTGAITLDSTVDRPMSPYRLAITARNDHSFTVGWTALVDPRGADPRIFIRTYDSDCR
jgi:hypothetical protein